MEVLKNRCSHLVRGLKGEDIVVSNWMVYNFRFPEIE